MTSININAERIYITAKQIFIIELAININRVDSFMFRLIIFLFCYLLFLVNSIPFTCANCGLVAPKTDLIYFFTSVAMSNNPVSAP